MSSANDRKPDFGAFLLDYILNAPSPTEYNDRVKVIRKLRGELARLSDSSQAQTDAHNHLLKVGFSESTLLRECKKIKENPVMYNLIPQETREALDAVLGQDDTLGKVADLIHSHLGDDFDLSIVWENGKIGLGKGKGKAHTRGNSNSTGFVHSPLPNKIKAQSISVNGVVVWEKGQGIVDALYDSLAEDSPIRDKGRGEANDYIKGIARTGFNVTKTDITSFSQAGLFCTLYTALRHNLGKHTQASPSFWIKSAGSSNQVVNWVEEGSSVYATYSPRKVDATYKFVLEYEATDDK